MALPVTNHHRALPCSVQLSVVDNGAWCVVCGDRFDEMRPAEPERRTAKGVRRAFKPVTLGAGAEKQDQLQILKSVRALGPNDSCLVASRMY